MKSIISTINNAGELHRRNGQSCQDVVLSAENGQYSAILLADGVSSCSRAREGAAAAVSAACELLMNNGKKLFGFNEKEIAEFTVEYVFKRLVQKAEENSCDINDFSSTLAFVLIDRTQKKALYFNMGDGLILSSDGKTCRVSAMPNIVSGGCYVTTTKNVEKTITCGVTDASELSSFVVLSDGAWRSLYNKTKMKPEIYSALSAENYNSVFDFLKYADISDDYSIISIKFGCVEPERITV